VLAYRHLADGADRLLQQLARRMLGKPERPGWIERMTSAKAKTATSDARTRSGLRARATG
jgi:hypothetical protein